MRRFKKGERINTMSELIDHIKHGEWLYWRDRPRHPSVIANMTLNTVLGAVEAGIITKAERVNQ